MNRTNQRGFTLVEIAIVLVIIGLLLGGILKGQELITSARVRNLADQTAGIQAAYYGFLDRFRAIPGDWSHTLADAAIPGIVNSGGNNNGRIDQFNTAWEEPLAAWEHLSKAGFLQGQYVGGANPPAPNSTDQAPRNAFDGFLALNTFNDPTNQATPKLHLNTGNLIPVTVTRELDVKLDDGMAGQGIVRGVSGTGPLVQSDPTCVTGSPAIWNVDGQSTDCAAAHLY